MKRPASHPRGAIELLEEAVHLLRRGSLGSLACYYIGSLPFFMGLLYFWADMSRNGQAEKYNTLASLGLALLFVWMKCLHTVFTDQLKNKLYHLKPSPWSISRLIRVAVMQTIVQATGFLLLPVALVIAIPFAWVYAFYQSFTVLGDSGSSSIQETCGVTWRQAQLWPGQNHILISVFALSGLVVFLNLGVTLYMLPHLLKSLFDIDTVFVRSGVYVLNTTFLAVNISLTYLCLDPLVKATYVLRCFYGVSRLTGDDLKTELQDHFLPGKKLIAALLLLIFVVPVNPAAGEEYQGTLSRDSFESATTIDPGQLQESIEEVLQQKHYTWRLPRQKVERQGKQGGLLRDIISWLINGVKYFGKKIGNLVKTILEWIGKIFPKPVHADRRSDPGGTSKTELLLGLLMLILLTVILYWGLKIWQQVKRETQPIGVPTTPALPDLESEEIKADDLKANNWLKHAAELLRQQSFRLALRALYFAILAHLAEQEIIIIAKYKSNHEYRTELNRRLHEHTELVGCFDENVKIIDRVWYGMYEPTAEEIEYFTTNQERIMRFAWK